MLDKLKQFFKSINDWLDQKECWKKFCDLCAVYFRREREYFSRLARARKDIAPELLYTYEDPYVKIISYLFFSLVALAAFALFYEIARLFFA